LRSVLESLTETFWRCNGLSPHHAFNETYSTFEYTIRSFAFPFTVDRLFFSTRPLFFQIRASHSAQAGFQPSDSTVTPVICDLPVHFSLLRSL